MSEPRAPASDDASPHRPATPILPTDWNELAPLVDILLDTPLGERDQVLDRLTAADPARRAALEQLVEECERDVPLLNRPAAERFVSLLDAEMDVVLPEILGERYRIARELGRGGMARVFLAHDLKHARDVAVKVISPDIAASLGRDRFLREISIAARLRHPNIVPLYDSGDSDGVLFFVMPYEEGPSLRERLASNDRPTPPESVSILRDVARALAYAHERGIVHRDVKPDNVMLSGGAAVVTDFGIAKAVSVAQGDAASLSTHGGAGLGTPAYMAPEQAIGDPSTDHRADIYSFGCLAYELFSGKPPFHGMPTHEIVAAHVGTKPASLAAAAVGVPPAVADLVDRCLEKRPPLRPQTAGELLAGLEGGLAAATVRSSAGERAPAPRVRIAIGVSGALAIALLAVTWYLGSRTRPTVGALPPREVAVAVLPMESVGGDSLQRELASGLSDEIATALFRVPGVRIMSRRGVATYRSERDTDYSRTAQELGARYLVMGSLREYNGQWRVLAKLVDATDGSVTWSGRFDRDRNELGIVRDQLADSMGSALQRVLGTQSRAVAIGSPARSLNPDAYRLYILAQRALDRRGLSIRASINMFREATVIEPTYSEAYSGLSLALALAPFFEPTRASEVNVEAVNAARRALQLDSTLSQPHITLGLLHQHANHWDSAATEFRTAIARDARDVEARVQYGRYLIFRERTAEALGQFLVARREEPASALVSSWVSYAYYLKGQMDSALVESARAFQSDTASLTTLTLGSLVHLKAGHADTARAFALRVPLTHPVGLFVLSALRDTASLRVRLRALERQRTQWSAGTARAYFMLGRADSARALDELERATDASEPWPSMHAVNDPLFDSVRNSDRFQRLLKRVGLR